VATYYRDMSGYQLTKGATADADTTIVYEVGTSEAQTITVSKNGGAFAATAGTTSTQIEGNLYKLVVHHDDIDTTGNVTFKSAGATDTQYLMNIQVVSHDVQDDIAAILADTSTDGVAIANGAITAAKFGADCITADKIADDAFAAEHFATGAITADTFAADAITSTVVADNTITAAKLGADCITSDKIADNAFLAVNFGADFITAAKIADDAFSAEHFATDCITNDALASSAVNEIVDQVWDEAASEHVNAGSISKLLQDGVSAAGVADAVLDELLADHTTAGSLSKAIADILADTGTDGVVLADDAITSAKIADDAFSSEHFKTDCLTADAFAADTLGASELAAAAASEIAASVTGQADKLRSKVNYAQPS